MSYEDDHEELAMNRIVEVSCRQNITFLVEKMGEGLTNYDMSEM